MILHMSRQLSCRDMYKLMTWLDKEYHYSNEKFCKILGTSL